MIPNTGCKCPLFALQLFSCNLINDKNYCEGPCKFRTVLYIIVFLCIALVPGVWADPHQVRRQQGQGSRHRLLPGWILQGLLIIAPFMQVISLLCQIIHKCLRQCCGSESGFGSVGSVCFWASWIWIRILLSPSKNSTKNLDSYCVVTFLDFLSLKND